MVEKRKWLKKNNKEVFWYLAGIITMIGLYSLSILLELILKER
jgi:hypothetical protein